ncbi:MAG: endonuclease/exonuclease/phosphatase family protein [Tannerella sp.]|jgi:endonuclease/exonuclease/phosphatase family metal-dependent hydrolase|nr:endonuclease/exonuclease/phosphatase family protein [Tannerella sp.]
MQAKNNKFAKYFNPFRLLFNSFFATLSIIFVALFIASAYSDHISPTENILFAYLGLAFPVFLIANVILLIYWLVTRKWFFVILFVITFAVCWAPISNYYPLHFKTKAVPEESAIKVLSYNVMSFAYKGHTKQSPNPIIQYIAHSDADIVCLQEYMVSTRENLMSSKDVADALHMYPYFVEITFSPQSNKRYKYGLAVLSKYPVTNSKHIKFPSSTYNGASMHTINVKGRKILLVNNHLESFKLTAEDRSKYSNVITSMSFESFDEFSGSIQQKLGHAFKIRAKQAEQIADEIKKEGCPYTLVCGDFNDTPISFAHRKIQGDLSDAFAETGCGAGTSYNQNLFLFRIDNIFHSANLEAYKCTIDRSVKLSDHYPIYCYFKIL